MSTSDLTQPTALYDGYDSFLGERRDGAVSGATSAPTGGETTSYVYVCTDSESVSSALSVSASVSGSTIDYSASAKASFTQQLSMTSTSVVVIVHTIVNQGTTSAEHYSLSSRPSDIQAFFTQYGDSFVDAIMTGGEYYAAFVYNSTTTTEQEQITASLKASAGALNATLSTSLDTAASNSQTSYTIQQDMIGATGVAAPTDAASIVTFAGNYGQYINSPEVLSYHVTGYERAGVTGFDAVVANRNLFGTDTTPANVASTLSALASTADTIQAMYDGYQYTGDSGFKPKRQQIDADLATIQALINKIEASVTGTYSAPSLPSLNYGTPVASYQVKPPIQTVTGGFYDLTAAQVASGVGPKQIVLTAGGFKVTYSDANDVVNHNAVGKTVGTLNIATGDSIATVEFPTDMSNVSYIVTANGVSVGTDSPTNFPVKAPPKIIGFAGTYKNAKDASAGTSYGVISITISPAVWGTSS